LPRPRQQRSGDAGPGLVFGALLGALVSPVGALIGGALGGMAAGQPSSVPVPLEDALRIATADRGLRMVWFVRTGSHSGRVAVRHGDHYHVVDAAAAPALMDRNAIDDGIYDQLLAQVDALLLGSGHP
jgi:hypothetical protein